MVNPIARQRRFPPPSGPVILIALFGTGIVLPVQAQKANSGPSVSDDSTISAPSTSATAPVPREIMAELEAMKKRIEGPASPEIFLGVR